MPSISKAPTKLRSSDKISTTKIKIQRKPSLLKLRKKTIRKRKVRRRMTLTPYLALAPLAKMRLT